MFTEKINKQLLEEIQEALYEERNQSVANWEGQMIDLTNEDFEDMLRSEIFSDYFNIPLYSLMNMINHDFPFIKEKDILIDPSSEIIVYENDNEKEFKLNVSVKPYDFNKKLLSEIELKQLNTLLEELTQLYQELDIDTTLFLQPVPVEDIPEDDEDDEDHEYFQIKF